MGVVVEDKWNGWEVVMIVFGTLPQTLLREIIIITVVVVSALSALSTIPGNNVVHHLY